MPRLGTTPSDQVKEIYNPHNISKWYRRRLRGELSTGSDTIHSRECDVSPGCVLRRDTDLIRSIPRFGRAGIQW